VYFSAPEDQFFLLQDSPPQFLPPFLRFPLGPVSSGVFSTFYRHGGFRFIFGSEILSLCLLIVGGVHRPRMAFTDFWSFGLLGPQQELLIISTFFLLFPVL